MDREFLSGLEWYVDMKDKAIEDVLALRTPLDAKVARLSYGLYFTSLLSLTEAVIEKVPDSKEKIHASLDEFGGMEGTQNYEYIKQLRNAITHRGFNVTASGLQHGDRVYLLAPQTIFDKWQKKEYKRFSELVEELMICCEMTVCPAVSGVLESIGFWEYDLDEAESRALTIESLNTIEHMPDWAKKMTIELLPTINTSEIASKRLAEFRSKLQARDLRSLFH